LISYKRTKLGCVADLRRLLALAERSDLNRSILDLTIDVLRRTENRCFSVAVVGEFKRGKSTFINALLGREILPADIRPCSAALNRVTYGLRPHVSIHYKAQNGGERRVEEIAIDQLEHYVTKLTPEAKHKATQIEEAVIHYPTEYCRHNVDIIDTPGLNDNQNMTAVTMSVIPKVDAAILVIIPEAPFGGYEGDFLTRHLLLQDLGRVLFVVTAIDRIRKPTDRERIVETIRDRIAEAVDARLKEQFAPGSEDFQRYRQQIGTPTVFPLSASLALEAQKENDEKLLEESRFTSFTSALEQFLTQKRGAIELQVLANQILATGEEIVKKINIEMGALTMGQREFQARYDESLGQLEALRRRRDSELRQIDEAAARTWGRLQPMVSRIGEDLKRDALAVIDSAEITVADVWPEKLPALTDRLSGQVSGAVTLRGQRSGEALQIEIERDIRSELERLQDFATTVGRTLQGIEGHLDTAHMGESAPLSVGTQSLVEFTDYGWKEQAVGLSTYFVTGVGGLLVAPVAIPVVIGVLLASMFTSGLVIKSVFGAGRVKRFTKQYRKVILEFIDAELQKRDLPGSLRKNVDEAYAAIKNKLNGELTAAIEQMQSTLDDLRNRKAREEVMTGHRRQELEENRQEVLAVRAKALGLANQLVEAANV
jgi:GTPase SAR1 family protein